MPESEWPPEDAEPWLKLQSIGGPWYEGLTPDQCYFRPQHRGEDKDPWRLEAVETGPPQKQKKFGSVLPAIARSARCPGQAAVPEIVKKGYDQSSLSKQPKVYVLAFPGCADAVNAEWVRLEMETPDHFEWATFEWPGHGERLQEKRLTDIADLGADAFDTFKEAMSTGSFILVGHSIGCLLMTYVAMRAEKQLGVRPLMCFALDRTAPHQMVYSAYAEFMRRTNPREWIHYWNHTVHTLLDKAVNGAEDTWDMFLKDEALTVDTLPLGSWKFPCKVFVFLALKMSAEAPTLEGARNEEERKYLKGKFRYYCNNKGYNFDPEEFEEWHKWSNDVVIHRVEADHKGVVTHTRFLSILYREIDNLLHQVEKKKKATRAR